jgi:hypothetical protein
LSDFKLSVPIGSISVQLEALPDILRYKQLMHKLLASYCVMAEKLYSVRSARDTLHALVSGGSDKEIKPGFAD